MSIDLEHRAEAVKLYFCGAFERGRKAGMLTEEQEQALIEFIDALDGTETDEAVKRAYQAIVTPGG